MGVSENLWQFAFFMHKQHPQTAYRKYAVSLHAPSRENGVQKRPQAVLNPEIKIIFR